MSSTKKQFTAEFFQQAGKKGGTSTAKRGKAFYQKIGALGGNTRWAKEKKNGQSPKKSLVSPTDDSSAKKP